MTGRNGPAFVSSFFRDRELNSKTSLPLKTVAGLWKFLEETSQTGLAGDQDGGDLSQLERATKVGPLVFRGQSDQSNGVSSSLYRFVRGETTNTISEPLLFDVEQHILAGARSRGLGKGLKDGPLLMLLQHYGFPTRLVDVSTGPLEALFFATERGDATDGRLFVFKLIERSGWRHSIDMDDQDLPWDRRATGNWTETVSLVEPLAIDPRMGAQGSKFLVGGLTRASADRNIHFEGHNNFLDKKELLQITTLSIGFHKNAPRIDRTPWHALGWSIRIPGSWKAELRLRLADAGISRESMYPSFSTVEWQVVASARDAIAGF